MIVAPLNLNLITEDAVTEYEALREKFLKSHLLLTSSLNIKRIISEGFYSWIMTYSRKQKAENTVLPIEGRLDIKSEYEGNNDFIHLIASMTLQVAEEVS